MGVPPPPGPATTLRTSESSLRIAWPRSAQLTTAFLLGLSTALLVMQVLGHLRWGARPTELDRDVGLVYRIDLNRADRAELLQLPGVGDNLAQRILDYRQEHGLFRNVNDLTSIKGIGPTTLETLRPWVKIHADAEEAGTVPNTSRKKSSSRAGASQKEANLTGRVDINQASAEELQRLPGIGPKISQRIVEERRKGSFRTMADLKRVHGIGPKTLQRLEPYISFEGPPVRVAAADES
jgi:competence protein ComEA